MPEPLKILMVGGRRCGKTSVLAALFDEMQHGKAMNYLQASDKSDYQEEKNGERKDGLTAKTLELSDMIEQNAGSSNIFLVDKAPTANFWDYKLSMQIPGTQRFLYMQFRDSAGEAFNPTNAQAEETKKYFEESDVFVIVVDTPYLMAGVDKQRGDTVTDACANATNRVDDLLNFISHINDHGGRDAKMVAFVPVKCERWAQEAGGLERVARRVEEVYQTHITHLSKFHKIRIAILPMQTCGDIVFEEFRKPYKLTANGTRCCITDPEAKILRLENGECDTYESRAKDLTIDPDAPIKGNETIIRPYCWFRTQGTGKYEPKGCDQLGLHILDFMLRKYADVKASRGGTSPSGILDFLLSLLRRILQQFGNIDPEELKSIIDRMRADRVIRREGDGIHILKDF